MATERRMLLSDLPCEIVWHIAGALDSLADVASLGATCTRLWQVCVGVTERRTHALRAAARESMDAFVDEWQRFATDHDDAAASQYRDPRLFHPNGCDTHDDGSDSAVDGHDRAPNEQTPDANSASPSDTADGSIDSDLDRGVDPRLRFCGSYRLFNLGSPPLEPCTGAPDWSLHVDSYECNRFVCDACARALAHALDDPHHVKWPMARVRMNEPHVWTAEWCGIRPDVYVPTPPVEACCVPAGLDAWIDPDAARCLAEDIRLARSLFDAECGPWQYDDDDGDDNGLRGEEEDTPQGYHDDGIPATDAVVDCPDGDDTADWLVRGDGDGSDVDLNTEQDDDGAGEDCHDSFENTNNESDNDDVMALRARRCRERCEGGGCDGITSDDSDSDSNDSGDSDRDNGDHSIGKNASCTILSAAALSSAGSVDHNGEGSDGTDHIVVFGDESDGAPRQDPFKCMRSEKRFDDVWPPRYDHDNPAPTALVRIYHAPVLLMGNLRAWLPIGMSRETCARPHGADVTRYVLVCCDPASPLWGAAMAVRVLTDRWPCIMWLPGADDAREAVKAYRRRPHSRSQKTSMGLREGFVHWLCTARRVPTPMEWEERLAAAVAARRPVVPLWTGFPRFSR